ncbi:BF3164 family lipoprotein [Sphingobacterium haloxyli]|uniref:Uncharacterized protein n=1 Tax=Sphingobacterium haloxyli TaxID=2100533 RepID=A0A2S9J010_9SPHI|nr:BF3164 family lipoprotein [Sphingobacterium haloxyli]PRD46115.1 hypothetical protein C5745_16970 [Sphingobacterium haloxyli]
MKTIFSVVLLMGLGCTMTSCSAVATADAVVFPETISLHGKEKAIKDSVYLKYPFRLRLNDDVLAVIDIHSAVYYIHTFDYKTMRHKQSLARRGEAPAEFLSAENIRIDRHGDVWALDANKSKIVKLAKQIDEQPVQIDLDKELVRALDFDRLNDSVFIVPDYTGQHRISFVSSGGDILRHAFQIPSSTKKVSAMVLAQAWRSFISYNSHHGILGMATQLGQVLEIYDIKRERVIKVIGQEHGAPHFVNRGGYAVPSGIMGYSDIHVGEEHIYALFWGSSFDDIRKRPEHHKEGGRFVHVFDLKGNPVRQYLLDRCITGFHIDEERGALIGLDVNSNQPIVEYTFNLD